MTKQEFWESFERHMPALEQLISGEIGDYSAYNALSDDLHAFNHYLVPEITMDTEKRFVLLKSCDGCRLGIPQSKSSLKTLKITPIGKSSSIANRAQ